MPLWNYTQYRFHGIPCIGGTLSLVIARDNPYYDLSDGLLSHTGHIDVSVADSRRFVMAIGPLKKARANDEGAIKTDEVEIGLRDIITYAGIASGSGAESFDFSADKTSLAAHIFSVPDVRYTVWLIRHDAATSTSEIYFSGDVNPLEVTYDHTFIHAAQTSDETVRQTVRFKARSATERLKSLTVADLLGNFVSGDMTAHNVNFYGGFTIADSLNNNQTLYKPDEATWDSVIISAAWYRYVDVTGYGKWEAHTGTWPAGTSGVTLSRIVKRIADTCTFAFTEATDYRSTFEGARPVFDTATDLYDPPVVVDADEVCVCYQTAFCLSHNDGNRFDTPAGWTWETTLADVMRGICFLTGTYLTTTLDQTTGRQRLTMMPLREDRGDFPGSLVLMPGSKEAARRIGKKRVEVKTKATDGAISVPDVEGDAITIEIPFRARAWGNQAAPAWENRHVIYNTKWDRGDDDRGFRRYHGGEPAPNNHPDGWLCGAHLFWYHSTDTNIAYPDLADPPGLTADLTGTWAGFYMLQSWSEKAGVTTNRYNTLYGPAQLYARENLGNRVLIEREYRGFLADDGTIAGLTPGMEATWWVRGENRTFRVETLEQDPIKNTTRVGWEEKPADYDALDDLSHRYIGEGESTSGSSGSTSATGGGSSTTVIQVNSISHARAVSSTNITLSGTQTIDTVALVVGDACLVNGQTAGEDNGVYVVSAGAWTRTDTEKVRNGHLVTVAEGTNEGSLWQLVTPNTIVLGTTALEYEEKAGGGTTYTAGNGIDIASAVISAKVDNATINFDGDLLRVKNDGITDGKLGTDVKVGSLAALNTTIKTDVVSAINEVISEAVYTEGDGIDITGNVVTADVDNTTVAIVTGKIAVKDAGVTNAKLATDVKVGSLAALTTVDKDSVTDAINEVVASMAKARVYLELADAAAASLNPAATFTAAGDPATRRILNLTNCDKVRFLARIVGPATATKLRIQYSTSTDPTIADNDVSWTTLATSSGTHPNDVWFYTAAANVPSGAQINNVQIRIGIYDGDGAASPHISACAINFYQS
jgi:hypothetical protein